MIGPLRHFARSCGTVVKVPANIGVARLSSHTVEAVVWTVSVLERSCVVVVHHRGTELARGARELLRRRTSPYPKAWPLARDAPP